jgi:hypothetical protein
VTGPARLLWESRSLSASSERLHAEDAMNRAGPREDPAAGRTRRCHGPRDQHVRPVLAAVVLVCLGPAPAGGWGG